MARIEANGGYIEDGWFVMDRQARARIVRCYGPNVPERIPLEPSWSNPTPPFAPTLGGHTDPVTGHYKHPDSIPWQWTAPGLGQSGPCPEWDPAAPREPDRVIWPPPAPPPRRRTVLEWLADAIRR